MPWGEREKDGCLGGVQRDEEFMGGGKYFRGEGGQGGGFSNGIGAG